MTVFFLAYTHLVKVYLYLYSAFTLVPSLYLEEKEIFILSLPQTYGGRADWDGKNRRDCLKFITF